MKSKKPIILIFIILLCSVVVLRIPGLATQNTCFKYEVETDYYDDTEKKVVRITEYYNNGLCSKNVVIPKEIRGLTVVAIGPYSFNDKEIESVIISESVNQIGKGAFSNNKLTVVIIPENVKEILSYAFSNNQIKELVIEDGLEVMLGYVFDNNEISVVNIPASVFGIHDGAFNNNPIKKVNIEREENIFAEKWEVIGFPIELLP